MTDPILSRDLQFLRGVGPRRAAELRRAGLSTIGDLLERLPVRYEDRTRQHPIGSLQPGQRVSITGEVIDCRLRPTRRRGFTIFEAVVRDDSGAVRAVWMNQAFMQDVLERHQRLVLYGLVEWREGVGLQMVNPQHEVLAGGEVPDEEGPHVTVHTGRIVPVYESIGSVSSNLRRRLAFEALQQLPEALPDPLPTALAEKLGLPTRSEALRAAHFPREQSEETLNRFRTPAQIRLIFEELFQFQLGLAARRRMIPGLEKAGAIRVDDRIRRSARHVLPFRLTEGQRQVLKEIVDDLQRPEPMNRLLQGDVGSGKTIVALLTALVVMENDRQVAFMAPTEILAEQHLRSLQRWLAGTRFRVGLLTGSLPAAVRRATQEDVAAGAVRLVVGTHALLQGDVQFRALGLVIIDEQHRFGVMQRAALREKGRRPDVLVMTATPIPRTLALTAYGDLDASTLRDMPPGRQPVQTLLRAEGRRDEVYRLIRRQLQLGRQAYVIYPLVAESEKVDLRAATEMADRLSREVFADFRVALLHGQLKAEDKDAVMSAFTEGQVDVLVATSVVEVGVDVPNAGIIVIEHAERFGLAQLHQLRGRVGRGAHPSTCVLVHQKGLSQQARERLQALEQTTDGFALAERDLEIRGPGDFGGTRQSGVPMLRVGDLLRDRELMELAREEARAWLQAGAGREALATWSHREWADRFGLAAVG